MALVVVVVALIARDLGGSRRAQVLAAIMAAVSGYLGGRASRHHHRARPARLGGRHVAVGAAARRRRPAALAGGGLVAGIGLENKDTLLFLGAGLAVGLVLARRWDVVRSPWAWAALGIAFLLWAPNLAWQAANGWPQLTMAVADRRVRRRQPGPDRAAAVAVQRSPAVPGERRRAWRWVLRGEGGGAVAADRDRRPRGARRSSSSAAARRTTRSAAFACSWRPAAIVLDRWLARGHRALKLSAFAAAAVPRAR